MLTTAIPNGLWACGYTDSATSDALSSTIGCRNDSWAFISFMTLGLEVSGFVRNFLLRYNFRSR